MNYGYLKDKTILVTGGTGSFGRKFTDFVLAKCEPKKLIVFSRDEFKQSLMAKKYPDDVYPIRYFIGDIRDVDRLYRAFEGVDLVVHAAALKQVPTLEYNPFEAVQTNVIGAQNIADAAIDRDVQKVIAISTDKAVSPINLYGATKLVMEKIFISANVYVGTHRTSFSVVRYGNVVGSRGSVLPLFLKLLKSGAEEFPITDERMTRFWITLEDGVKLVISSINSCVGGEIIVPKIPSMRIMDMFQAIAPGAKYKIIGIRPGEKIHETLISEDEARFTMVGDNNYVIFPTLISKEQIIEKYKSYVPVENGFVYRSDLNDRWLSPEDIRRMIKDIEVEEPIIHM